MRLRDIIICIAGAGLFVALVGAAGMRLDFINSQRQEMELISNEPLENAPPSLAFATVAMGAFRGLVVDVLWIRADRLKEEGQFFDAKQLAEWITILQPRFSQVWEFQAWNMAYNISVAIPAEQPEQRWQWVKNGYELLRDRGIPRNPKDINLYRELGRIFQHKVGGLMDDCHKYYKLQLARSMTPLLGPGTNEYFRQLAEAPQQWSEVAEDVNIAPLIDALRAADAAFEDDKQFIGNYLSLRQKPARFKPEAFRVIDKFRGTPALAKFDIFAKAWQLRNIWKLEPALMDEINRMVGPVDYRDPNKHLPLDWRNADSHAIYWAVKGLKVAGEKDPTKTGRDAYSSQEVNTDRIVGHSLQNLFRYGKIFIYDLPQSKDAELDTSVAAEQLDGKTLFLRPDLRMFEPYNQAILDIIDKYTDELPGESSHEIGHRNFLTNALFSFYQAGHRQKAQQIYNDLRKRYPREEFKSPSVEVYVKRRLREELENITYTNAQEMVAMMLREAYFRYAVRDDDEAAALEQMAEQIHRDYREAYRDENRIDLPDVKLMKYTALTDFLNDQQYPLSLRRALLARIELERPQLYRQFESIAEQMRQEAEQSQ